MRLYCPTCRTESDESDQRYHELGGRIPCRVCRDVLIDPPVGGGFSEPAPTEHMNLDQMEQVFTIDTSGKTTMLELPTEEVHGKTTMIDPSVIAAASAAAGMQRNAAPPGGGHGGSPADYSPEVLSNPASFGRSYTPAPPVQAPRHSAPASGSDGAFHSDPTFIFSAAGHEQAPPSQPIAPPPQQRPPPAAAPRPQQGQSSPGRDRTYKRKVVVGGAAVQNAEQKTQVLDLDAFRQAHNTGGSGRSTGDMVPQMVEGMVDGMVPVSPPPMQDAATSQPLVIPGPQGQMPMGQAPMQSAPPPMHHVPPMMGAEPRGKLNVPLILVVLLLFLGGIFLLMAFEVLPRPGFVPSFAGDDDDDDDGDDGDGDSARAAVELSDMFVSMRSFVQPAIVSTGESPTGSGVTVGVMSSATGDVYHWIATPRRPQPQELEGELIDAIPDGTERVYLMFDATTDTGVMVNTLDRLRDHEFAPVIVGGSHLGADSYFAYPAYAPEEAVVSVRLDGRSVVASKPGWPAPQTFCYRSSIPAERVSGAIDQAFQGASPPFDVQVELAPGLELQAAYNLAQALYRPGLLLYITRGSSVQTPAECQ